MLGTMSKVELNVNNTYQIIEEFSEFVFAVRSHDIDVLQEQLVSVANLLQRDVDHRLGDQRGFGVLKQTG